MAAPQQRIILWFRNDLRLTDNYIIIEAARRLAANKCSQVVPVYCLDPRQFGPTRYSSLKTGPFRTQFLLESVADLKRQLQSIGSDLLLFHDKPESVIPRLMKPGAEVLAQEEVCSEELRVDRRVRSAIKAQGGKLELIWGATMYHKDDLGFDAQLSDMPDVFTPFKDRCAAPCAVLVSALQHAAQALPAAHLQHARVMRDNRILPISSPPAPAPASSSSLT
jgi:deoxyribodipyrimidine photo-lyase